jgi:hypothetical protein
MAELVSLSIQKRVNALDVATTISMACAIIASSSILMAAFCLFVCLFLQAIVFRVHFKYTRDSLRMAKRIAFILGDFIAILLLLFHNKLI